MNAAANLAVVLLCVTALTATSPVAGQTTPTVKAGTRVRVTHNEAYRVQQVARVVWSNADSAMVVFVDPPTGPVISSMTVIKTGERRFIRISDVEVSAGAKTNEMDGVVGGAAVGLGLGAFLGNIVGEDCGGASSAAKDLLPAQFRKH